MKVLCVCDLAIDLEVMKPMKELERFGAEVVLFKDEMLQTSENITRVMLKTEQFGADAADANPELVKAAEDADIIVVHSSPINSTILENAPKLKYVMVLRSGIENVNETVCRERGITIINAPGRSAPAVADMTVGMMLAENKNIARGHKALKDGIWLKDFVNLYYIHDMRRSTVGIIGMGEIGKRVEERLKGFGCKVIVYDPFIPAKDLESMGYCAVSKEELLMQSDYVTVHLRLSEKTKHFIGKEELDLMKETAYFINTARAGLVDEAALISALESRSIGGAALDVFENEPLGTDHPLLQLDNVTLTPHVAGTSMDTFANSVEIIYKKAEKLLE